MTVDEESRKLRARGRANFPGQIVDAGQAKPALYAELGPMERLRHMSALCLAQWQTAHGEVLHKPRSQWPGEVFRIGDG